MIQFVGNEEGPEIGGHPSGRRRQADKRSAFAAKLRKDFAKADAPAAAADEAPADEGTSEE